MAAADAVDVHQHLWPPSSSSTGCALARARRTCGAGRCTRTANRLTRSTRRTTTWRGGSRRTTRTGSGWPACRSPPRSASRGWRARGRDAARGLARRGRVRCPSTSGPGRRCRRSTRTSTRWRACWPPGSSACSCPRPTCSRRPRGSALARARASPRPRASRCFVHPGPEVARPLARDAAGVVGAGRRLHQRSCRRPGGAGTPPGGATLFPRLRVLFAAGAGLAPVHHERHVARGGEPPTIDPDVYVDTSSYGPQALDALVRVLGIDVLVLGSDRPYAAPHRAGCSATPRRTPSGSATRARLPRRHRRRQHGGEEGRTWPRAS